MEGLIEALLTLFGLILAQFSRRWALTNKRKELEHAKEIRRIDDELRALNATSEPEPSATSEPKQSGELNGIEFGHCFIDSPRSHLRVSPAA